MTKILVKRGLDIVARHSEIYGMWTPNLAHIYNALLVAEKRINLLKKTERLGAEYEFMSVGPCAAAYSWSVNGVRVTATQISTGIRIDSITRTKRYPKQVQTVTISLNEKQKSTLASHVVERIMKG